MKLVLPGGSGQVGTALARGLMARGHEVVVLSRDPRPAPWRVVAWDAATLGPWTRELEGADAVVNLTGRSVNCRYTAKNRALIFSSRLGPTRLVGEAIAKAKAPPRVWLQASTATIYAHRHDADNDEVTGVLGGHEPDAPETWRFSIDVATAWERVATEAARACPRTRLVLMRSAMTMSPDPGGIFATLLRLVRLRLGGKVGDGRQFVSWIHEEDFVRAVLWLVDHEELAGPVNLAAPHPLPYEDFVRALRRAWGVRIGLPTPRWMLEVGAFFLRTESELVLKSRRVVPARLLASGFAFRFPDWEAAAEDFCRRRRRAPSAPPRLNPVA